MIFICIVDFVEIEVIVVWSSWSEGLNEGKVICVGNGNECFECWNGSSWILCWRNSKIEGFWVKIGVYGIIELYEVSGIGCYGKCWCISLVIYWFGRVVVDVEVVYFWIWYIVRYFLYIFIVV